MNALVVGGTRGVGAALVDKLVDAGWDVHFFGRDMDLRREETWSLPEVQYDFVAFLAGDLRPFPWDRKSAKDYVESYWVHALGPVYFLSKFKDRFPWWARVCFVSSVGATNDGIVDLAYGMAKAALDKAARSLAAHEAWHTFLVRFDLVDTDTMRLIPTDTMHGRPVLSVDEAADEIVRECGLLTKGEG